MSNWDEHLAGLAEGEKEGYTDGYLQALMDAAQLARKPCWDIGGLGTSILSLASAPVDAVAEADPGELYEPEAFDGLI